MDGKGRSQGQHQIGAERESGRPFEIRRPQRLTEADRGWLQQAPASAAGRMPRNLEGLEVRRRIARDMAALAFHQQVRRKLDEHTG